jgi:NAD(P)-dependent dehydrogenase (short-subunit alcohol dehydrogenase family)
MTSSRRSADASPLPAGTFRDQVAFVTGGGTGLGFAVSLLLGRLGAHVVCASRDIAHHARLLERGRVEGFEVLSLAMDVRDPAAVKAAVRAGVERFGRIDVLINNAAGNFVRPALLLAPKAFATVIDIALNGVFNVSREVGKHMVERGQGGVIVNISAPYAATGKPGVIHSACAKAGVDALTKTLAAEWAPHKIRVNAVAPGPFVSQGAAERLWPSDEIEAAVRAQIPLGRFGTAEEVAEVVAYLASPLTPWMTGTILVLDGGWSLPTSLAGAAPLSALRRRRPPSPETPSASTALPSDPP